MEIPKKSRCDKCLIFAIDIGTHYTGCAFSMNNDWANVKTLTWTTLLYSASNKLPTCLLLRKDDKLQSCVGYEAEEKYMDLNLVDHHHEYYFFKHFPAALHEGVCIL